MAFRDLTVCALETTESPVPEFPSKKTSSAEPGTEALFAPPDVSAQFVLPVAIQLVKAPPPTQYLFAAEANPALNANPRARKEKRRRIL